MEEVPTTTGYNPSDYERRSNSIYMAQSLYKEPGNTTAAELISSAAEILAYLETGAQPQ